MFGLLALAFLVVPIVEIYLIIQVGSAIGGLETVGLLILVSIVGAWLVRHQGLAILARLQQSLARAEMPTDHLIDGLLVLLAGALMLTPGFLTDGVGLFLLLPPTRALARAALKRRFAGRIQVGRGAFGGPFGSVRWADVTVHDTSAHDTSAHDTSAHDRATRPDERPPELGP